MFGWGIIVSCAIRSSVLLKVLCIHTSRWKQTSVHNVYRSTQYRFPINYIDIELFTAGTWYNTLLVTNIYQAHLRKLRCWGCLQRVDKRTNSHAYGEGVLKAAASLALKMPAKTIIKEQLFWLHGPCSASKCTLPVLRECLCHKCDSSTSDWEKALHNQFGKQRIILTMKGMNEDITELVLLMQVFRGAMMSIDGAHMLSCLNCERYSQQVLCTMLYLAKLHRFVCENFEHKPKEHNETEEQKKVYLSTIKDARNRCKQLPAVVRHTTEHIDVHQIEYPLVAIVPDIGPVIYAQIVPYYIVIPTVRENIGKLDDIQLRKIIDGVNIELDYRHREFYDSNEGGRNWKDSLFKKNCRPMLVFPYHNQCCIQLSWTTLSKFDLLLSYDVYQTAPSDNFWYQNVFVYVLWWHCWTDRFQLGRNVSLIGRCSM